MSEKVTKLDLTEMSTEDKIKELLIGIRLNYRSLSRTLNQKPELMDEIDYVIQTLTCHYYALMSCAFDQDKESAPDIIREFLRTLVNVSEFAKEVLHKNYLMANDCDFCGNEHHKKDKPIH